MSTTPAHAAILGARNLGGAITRDQLSARHANDLVRHLQRPSRA
jgi:hypothetical protein